jgi:hypothetical protein
MVFDHSGSYSALLLAGIPMGLVSGWLIGGLGPYPDWRNPLSYRVNTSPRPSDSVA